MGEGESAAIRWPFIRPEPASHPRRLPKTSALAVYSRDRFLMVFTPGWLTGTGTRRGLILEMFADPMGES
jgi:hypothetical protein